ncbi:hypothetical protein J1N09_01740 [Aureitalea sp. L0-47]|uniref:hypothetical protein n=1 Tax=Aureitalea sp. L0-47 TaxID=2816962 RepID=UPI00223843B9|nr:hypothetical protein [Aureitalea sp. L0-47]MCW5518543.1 hypothetical protein [Aureitalea sp. L0-47]
MKAADIEKLFTELIAIYENLKAEVIVAEIQENADVTAKDFVITNKSTFSRPYRRDIIDVDNLTYDDALNLNLSRNGIYDQLPEGLFHQNTSAQSEKSFSEKRKQFRKEEEEARSFFAPIENEIFYQRLSIEVNERGMLDDFYNLNDDFLIQFWNIQENIPEQYRLKLVKILPHSYKIVGDLELTRLSLEEIIDDKVGFKIKYENRTGENGNKEPQKHDNQLGVDMVLVSEETEVLQPILEVTIGPVSESKINNYLKKDGILNFINTFYDYFVPMEFEVETKFIVDNENGFSLDTASSPIVGISTRI